MTDCSLIQSEGPFFNPNTTINHDSVLINLYYKSNSKPIPCWFRDSALITITNPSYDKQRRIQDPDSPDVK
ncbi:hypothetical protein P3S68_016730 [Capsicum galapagoense]